MNGKLSRQEYSDLLSAAPESAVVGSGYNVISSSYISGEYIKLSNPIVDLNKCNDIYRSKEESISRELQIEGSTLLDYMMSFNAKLNVSINYLLFSSDISTEFTYSTSTIEKNSFFKYDAFFYRCREWLAGEIPYDALTSEFRIDIEGMEDIERLFDKYGTHMVKDIYLGGRLNFAFSYMKKERETHTQASATAAAGFKSIFKAKAEAEYNDAATEMVEKSKVQVSSVGGNLDKKMSNLTDFHENLNEWVASLADRKNWVACGVGDMTSLAPIWEFCRDTKRAEAIESKYYEMLYKSTRNIKSAYTYAISDIAFISDTTRYKALSKCPHDYVPVYKDINKDDDEKFSFLCFKPTLLASPRDWHISKILLWVSKERDDIRAILTGGVTYTAAEGYANHIHELRNGSYVYAFCCDENYHDPIDIDVYCGETQIPPNYKYVEWATGGKANCNIKHTGEPVYIISNVLVPRPSGALKVFSICLKREGAYRVCFFEPGDFERAREYNVTPLTKLDDTIIETAATSGLNVITQILENTGEWPSTFESRIAVFTAVK